MGQNQQNKKLGWVFLSIGGVALMAMLLAMWYAFIYRRRMLEDDEDDE